MAWFALYLDCIAKRICRYFLERILGQFLKEKLTVDQLNIDLFNGLIAVTDLDLDVLIFNDVISHMKIPVKVMDVFVKEISVAFPYWSSLWTAEFSDIKVHGVAFKIKNKGRGPSDAPMKECLANCQQLLKDYLQKRKKIADVEPFSDRTERFVQALIDSSRSSLVLLASPFKKTWRYISRGNCLVEIAQEATEEECITDPAVKKKQ